MTYNSETQGQLVRDRNSNGEQNDRRRRSMFLLFSTLRQTVNELFCSSKIVPNKQDKQCELTSLYVGFILEHTKRTLELLPTDWVE